MKKGLKLTLAVLMVVSVLASLMLTVSAVAVPDSYLDASKYVISDGTVSNASQPIFKDGKVTFKINISSGVTVTGAMVTVKFDKKVLRLVDAGPVTKKDADGNSTEVITGMHTHGFSMYDNSAYTFAFISGPGFNTGNSGKEFAFITFEVIDKTYPKTKVEFVAGDYTSTATIKKFEGRDGTGFATLDSGEIVSFSAGKRAVTVKWNAVPGATEYLLYRKGGEDKEFRAIATWKDISYTDTENIQSNTTYTYAVRAKNANGYGWYSGKTFSYIDPTIVTIINTTSGVRVAWEEVDGATGYRVYKRAKGQTAWTRIDKVESKVLAVTDKEITSGAEYEYSVVVEKGANISAMSNIGTAKFIGMVSKVTLANASTGVYIKWTTVEGAQKYSVFRKVKGETSWVLERTINTETYELGDTCAIVDTSAVSGKTNYYAVRAYGNGAWSAYTAYAINYIATPQVTKTTSVIGSGITLNWNAVPGAAQYRVYRANGSKWVLLGKVTGTSYTDKNVTVGSSYKYTVRAENVSNLSAYNSTGWTVKYTLTTPTVNKVITSSTAIKIQWGAVKGAEGYRVYRKAPGATSWSQVAKTTATSYVDKNVKSGAVYTYTVRAYKGSTLSAYNTSGWIGVILKTPTVKIANYTTGMKVAWSKISGAANYIVYRSQYNESTGEWTSWAKLATLKSHLTSCVDKTAKSGVYYKYTVRAVNGLCNSSFVSSDSLKYLAQPTVTISNTSGGIAVKWTKSAGATNYKIYRSQFDAEAGIWTSWKGMRTVTSNVTSWADTTVQNGVSYKYTVRSASGKVASSFQGSASLMFLDVPELIDCRRDTSGIIFQFSQNESADSYRIYRKTLYTGWTLIDIVTGKENTTYTDANIIESAEYIYTARAVNGKSISYYNTTGISCAE